MSRLMGAGGRTFGIRSRGLLFLLRGAMGAVSLCAVHGHAADNVPNRLHVSLSLQTETVSDLSGGLRTGTVSDTLLRAGATTGGAALCLPSRSQLHLSAVVIRSGQPSREQVGDVQGLSNIAASSASRIYELWYRQSLGRSGALRTGLIDLNAFFVTTNAANNLLNSSFGIPPAISLNAPTSIYPTPGYGTMYDSRKGPYRARIGLFQGIPRQRSSPFGDGYMAIGEFEYDRGQARYKFGMWHHHNVQGPGEQNTDGYYFITDVPHGLRLRPFLQLAAAPQHDTPVPYYLGIGADLRGPIPSRPRDHLAAGVASAWLRESGTAISYELTYIAPFGRHMALQPDLQYIHDPAGIFAPAWAAIVRLTLML